MGRGKVLSEKWKRATAELTHQITKPCLSYQKSSLAVRDLPRCSVAELNATTASGVRPWGLGRGVG